MISGFVYLMGLLMSTGILRIHVPPINPTYMLCSSVITGNKWIYFVLKSKRLTLLSWSDNVSFLGNFMPVSSRKLITSVVSTPGPMEKFSVVFFFVVLSTP